jgi:hypothetical protein
MGDTAVMECECGAGETQAEQDGSRDYEHFFHFVLLLPKGFLCSGSPATLVRVCGFVSLPYDRFTFFGGSLIFTPHCENRGPTIPFVAANVSVQPPFVVMSSKIHSLVSRA